MYDDLTRRLREEKPTRRLAEQAADADVIVSPYEYSSLETNDNTLRLVALGHIRGILDMADCIKEVLKS